MPCTDGGVPFPPSRHEVLHAKMPAALCGLLAVLLQEFGIGKTNKLINMIDAREAGVSPEEIKEWWAEHKTRDLKRLRREAKAKLTKAEREALGIEDGD